MDFMQVFQNIMETTSDIALATSVGGVPNVRIVNFIWSNEEKAVYLSTFKNSTKTTEMAQNDNVAFITIPVGSMEFVRASRATVKLSEKPMAEMQDTFVKKYPGFAQMYAMGLDKFEFYEIRFTEASVTRNFGDYGTIKL